MTNYTIVYRNSLDETKNMVMGLSLDRHNTLKESLKILDLKPDDVIVFKGKHAQLLKEEINLL